MRHATVLSVLSLVFTAIVLPALPALAQAAAADEQVVDPKLAQIAVHAAAIAVAIRGIVALLRSPIGGLLWLRVPVGVRLLVLALLGAVAVGLETLAAGKPLAEAIFIGIGGIGGAISTHEIQERLVPGVKR